MHSGWRVVVGSFAGMMMTGGFFTYAFSLLVDPIRQEFDTSLEQVMYSLTIGVMLGLVMSPITGTLIDRYSVRALMSLGVLGSALGFYLMGQSSSILMFNITAGLGMTMTMNLAGAMPASAAVTRWFTANRGRALGISAMGTSVGGMLYPALLAYWIEAYGWRAALNNMALSNLLVILPLVWFNIRDYPPPAGATNIPADAAHTPTAPAPSGGFGDILRHPHFWLLGLSMGMVFSAFSSMLANLSPYAARLGADEAQISVMIALLAASGLAGKIGFGMAADRIPLKQGLWMAHSLLLVAFVILTFEPPYTLMLAAAMCIGLCTGGLLPVWNALVARMFGIASFGRAMGAMGPIITLCILPGYAIVGRLFDTTGSYTLGLIAYSYVIVFAAALLVPLKTPE